MRLQNGLNLGYEAVFDLSRPFWMPIAIPKFRDGTPLVESDIWPIYVTDTTIHGLALGNVTDKDFWLAWRADTGYGIGSEKKGRENLRDTGVRSR